MSETLKCKVLVLGGGPGGYVAAIRSARHGLDTVLVESQRVGGTCLNVGCIPSKALIHVAEEFATVTRAAEGNLHGIHAETPSIDLAEAIAWKDSIVDGLAGGVGALLKSAGVRVVNGHGTMIDGKTCQVDATEGPVTINAENVILATGSTPVELPGIAFSDTVISSDDALSLDAVPEHFVVIGAGYIGLELGMAFAKIGSRVTMIEADDRALSMYDPDLVKPVTDAVSKIGIDLRTNTKAIGATSSELTIENADGSQEALKFDRLLVTVGRKPAATGWGLDALDLDRVGEFIKVDERCETSMTRVFAIGDVTGEPMLAHRAMAQATVVADNIAGKDRVFDPAAIPAIVFTNPEIVSVGLLAETPDSADRLVTAQFPLAHNGRSLTLDSTSGFVRVTARKEDHAIVGIEAVGAGVSELAAAFTLAIEMGSRLEDIADTIHAHPTIGESVQEASMKALGLGVHG